MTAAEYRDTLCDTNEHEIQKSCVRWFDLQYPGLLLYAIPNGGKRHIITAKKMKAEGVRRGVPDLHLAVPTANYPGLYIETKTRKGELSKYQVLAHAYLRGQGYAVEVVRNLEEFQTVINNYLNENPRPL